MMVDLKKAAMEKMVWLYLCDCHINAVINLANLLGRLLTEEELHGGAYPCNLPYNLKSLYGSLAF